MPANFTFFRSVDVDLNNNLTDYGHRQVVIQASELGRLQTHFDLVVTDDTPPAIATFNALKTRITWCRHESNRAVGKLGIPNLNGGPPSDEQRGYLMGRVEQFALGTAAELEQKIHCLGDIAVLIIGSWPIELSPVWWGGIPYFSPGALFFARLGNSGMLEAAGHKHCPNLD